MVNKMDDIILPSKNQNSVYVLNSNGRVYEEFAHLNLTDSTIATNASKCQHSLTPTSGNRSCSACSEAFQSALRNLGNFNDVTETIGYPATIPPPLLMPIASSTATTTPTATSCLPPAAAAFQKLFKCSYVANVSGGNSVNAVPGARCCGGGVDVNTALGTCKIESINNNKKKKSAYVKPSLIAKKTKFRKFIEKEKWNTCDEEVSKNECQRHRTNNNGCIHCSGFTTPDKCRTNSCVKESNAAESTALTATKAAMVTCGPLNNIVKYYWNSKIDSNDAGSGTKRNQRQMKSSNWSENDDNNNQQQENLQMLKSSQQRQKNNYELYKEAAELIGLSCTLCDNCRCLECQSVQKYNSL
ncbi:uncharacterized protein [Eurosta solidaginis]|uniref:uncharacterized protein isoform X2 n=1 Tax=Eurosta solidaginis TaxID=178769 RepID=UPI0035306FE2